MIINNFVFLNVAIGSMNWLRKIAEDRIFKLLWKYTEFIVWCRDLGKDVCRNSGSVVYEDEQLCA